HHLASLFGKFFTGVMRDLFDLRILEHRDVEICRFFRLVIEPQHWSNSLHASYCAQRDAVQSPSRTGPSALAIQMDLALALSPAEFPRTRRARGFSGRGPRES